MDINSTIVFERNAVRDVGGALFIESSGQIRVFPHTVLLFDSNSGRLYNIKYKIDLIALIIGLDQPSMCNLKQPVLFITVLFIMYNAFYYMPTRKFHW